MLLCRNVAFGMHSLQFMAMLNESGGDATKALEYYLIKNNYLKNLFVSMFVCCGRYARSNFEQFQGDRSLEVARLMGAITFCGDLTNSPYTCLSSQN